MIVTNFKNDGDLADPSGGRCTYLENAESESKVEVMVLMAEVMAGCRFEPCLGSFK